MMKKSVSVRRMAVSAMFLSIALVLKTFFSLEIPLFGENGMRVGISGVFSMMPSLMYGPFYGAVVSGLSDLMGYVLKPTGAFMPLLTLTAALGGLFRGGLFMALRKKHDVGMRVAVIVITALLLAVGIANIAFLKADGVDNTYYDRVLPEKADTQGMHGVSRLVVTRTADTKNPADNLKTYLISMTMGPLGCGVLGLLFILVDLFVEKKLIKKGQKVNVLGMLVAVIASGLLISTVNTVILRESVYASWKVLPFAVVWIPRAIEEVLVSAVKVCFMAVLMGLFSASPSLRRLAGEE